MDGTNEFAFLSHHPMLVLGCCAFLVSLICGVALTAVWCKLSWRLGALDRPDGKLKCHGRPTPTVGGIPLILAVFCGAAGLVAASRALMVPVESTGFNWGAWLVASLIVLGVGVSDDMRGVTPRTKLVFQCLSALVLVGGGLVIQRFDFFGMFQISLGLFAVPFTLFWLVGSCNAFNFIDGMDGLASGLGAVISLVLATMAYWAGLYDAALISLILCGGLTAVLLFNMRPAKIFLGDSGSQLIGLILAALTIRIVRVDDAFALPSAGLILSLPIFDTLLSIMRRWSQMGSPASGDHRHIHHCLFRAGLSVPQVSATLWAVAGITGLMGMACRYGGGAAMAAASVMFVGLELYLGVRLGCVDLRHLTGRSVGGAADDTLETMASQPERAELDVLWNRMKPLFEQFRLDRAELTLETTGADGLPDRKTFHWARSEEMMLNLLSHRWTRRFALNEDASRVAVLHLESTVDQSRDEKRINNLMQEIGNNMRLVSGLASVTKPKMVHQEAPAEELAEVV